MSEFHTDALRPSSLPTASLGRRNPTTGTDTGGGKDSDAELDKVAEDWNVRIDKEMKNLTGGLGELVELADVRFIFLSPLLSPSSSSFIGPFVHIYTHFLPNEKHRRRDQEAKYQDTSKPLNNPNNITPSQIENIPINPLSTIDKRYRT